jgi:hypothetical protein
MSGLFVGVAAIVGALRWPDIDLVRGAIGFRRGPVDVVSKPVLVSAKLGVTIVLSSMA